MVTDGASLAKTLGTCGTDVVSTEGVEHQVALVPRVARQAQRRQGDRRQQQVLHTAEQLGPEVIAVRSDLTDELEELRSGRLVDVNGTELQQDRQHHRRGWSVTG